MCRDEILLYPTISGRTDYSQDEVEQITLKRIIDKLQAKEQECKQLKKQNEILLRQLIINDGEDVTVQISQEQFEEYQNYKQALDEIEECCKQTCRLRCTNDCLGTRKHCGYGAVLDIINKAKEK